MSLKFDEYQQVLRIVQTVRLIGFGLKPEAKDNPNCSKGLFEIHTHILKDNLDNGSGSYVGLTFSFINYSYIVGLTFCDDITFVCLQRRLLC